MGWGVYYLFNMYTLLGCGTGVRVVNWMLIVLYMGWGGVRVWGVMYGMG